MTDDTKRVKVESRNEAFTEKTATKIWQETPSDDNPYNAKSARCYGYDLFELMEKRSFIDVLYLLFRGELPNRDQAKLLEILMTALISPGPRHPATRAAMVTGVGKSHPVHILPISSAILGGEYLGAGEIEASMKFIRKNKKKSPENVMQELNLADKNLENQKEKFTPGFGSKNGSCDQITNNLANIIEKNAKVGDFFIWSKEFVQRLSQYDMGWLPTGLAAAILSDLGFQPRAATVFFQYLGAPGLIAHGVELSNKPITAMPYVKDSNYVIEE